MIALKCAMSDRKRGGWTNPYVTDGLVGYWDGEWNADGGKHDSAQDSLVDLSGGGHDMTFVGTHTINPKSVTIDGVANAYGSINGLTWGPQSTQEFVVNISAKQSYGRLIAEAKGLCVTDWAGGYTFGHCYGFNTDSPVGSYSNAYLNTTYSIVLTYDGSYLRYYVNGQFVNSKTQTFLNQMSGQTTFFNRTSGARGVSGNLYCARIYSRALTAEEIAANYAVDKERFNLT